MSKKFILFFICFTASIITKGQGISWAAQEGVTSDEGKAKEQYTLMTDGSKSKDWESVAKSAKWLIAYNPKIHKSVYQNGTIALRALEKKAKDPTQKAEYQDMVLKFYKMRIENFGQEKYVVKKVGGVAYKYLKDRKGSLDTLVKIYDKEYSIYGKEMPRTHTLVMMILACNQKKAGKVDDKQVLARYDQLMEIVEAGLAKSDADEKAKAKWNKTKQNINSVLESCVEIDCDFVRTNLGSKLKADPNNIKLAKKVMKYMLAGKCISDPLFLVASKTVLAYKPNGVLAKVIATQHMSKKETDSALVYYNKAANILEADSAKAAIYLTVGKILNSKGKLGQARDYAYKAAKASSSTASKAYSFIADMYMRSGASCGGSHPVNGRVAYMAAYDMYSRAGNSSGMSRAKSQFPSKTDIFTFGMKEGQSMSVGCWIGGSTTLRVR